MDNMSPELIVSIVTAGVSAVASVVGALIQANNRKIHQNAAKYSQQFNKPERKISSFMTMLDFGKAETGSKGIDWVWVIIGMLIVVEVAVLGYFNPQPSAALNAVFIIPILTLILGLGRPIGWGYAALAVTLLHTSVFVTTNLLTKGSWDNLPETFLLSFLANVLIVGGITFIRTKAKPAALGGAIVMLGLGALAWLIVPMVTSFNRPSIPYSTEMQKINAKTNTTTLELLKRPTRMLKLKFHKHK